MLCRGQERGRGVQDSRAAFRNTPGNSRGLARCLARAARRARAAGTPAARHGTAGQRFLRKGAPRGIAPSSVGSLTCPRSPSQRHTLERLCRIGLGQLSALSRVQARHSGRVHQTRSAQDAGSGRRSHGVLPSTVMRPLRRVVTVRARIEAKRGPGSLASPNHTRERPGPVRRASGRVMKGNLRRRCLRSHGPRR